MVSFSSLARVILVSTALSLVTACTKKNSNPGESSDGVNIFSDRPIAATSDVFVITLNSPALLTTAVRGPNGWEIPAEAKAKVLAEQAAFEAKLPTVAPGAKIIYRYRLTLNGLAIHATTAQLPALEALPGVQKVKPSTQFLRAEEPAPQPGQVQGEVTSVSFIGGKEAEKRGITGRGMKIGIIDTGIDFTHAMLGGSGNVADYTATNPNLPSAFFPNAKVVGGLDLVGTEFDAASPFDAKRVPLPDANPIDEAGHGSHVAGTVAGIGDGVNSYDGVAKDASLYAIKVFGANGSTMDSVVIAGFEYAVDPNGDLAIDDQLDVVNLSLGGGFGQPQILYTEAVRNLSRTGMVVVASAGNSGPIDYIVGAPGTSAEALSVAASVDGSEHNWVFSAVRFATTTNPDLLAKATEGTVGVPIAQIGPTEGELFDIGLADVDLTPELAAQLQGKVALVKRGKVTFVEKVRRAYAAGAIGVVVQNHEPGEPIPMAGDEKAGPFPIPAIMISQALGLKLTEEMKLGSVRIQFKTGESIREPDRIDKITSFSSKGPRSEDNLLKPEIAAPGQAIISAAMGQGNGSAKLDGTSMAAPHMAGVIALIKQAHPDLSGQELKALAMNTAKVLDTGTGPYPISLQGAGRVQIDQAITSPVVVQPAGISLGMVAIDTSRSESRSLTVRNLSTQSLELGVKTESNGELAINIASNVTVPAGATVNLPFETVITLREVSAFAGELNGRILFTLGDKVVAQVPMLAIRVQASQVTTAASAVGPVLAFMNNSPVNGMALAFNLLAEDARKQSLSPATDWKSRSCDLQSVGYRVLRKVTNEGPKEVVQFAFKVFQPLTTWHLCEVSVLIDANGDGTADQELAGIAGAANLQTNQFSTVLLDAAKARDIRLGIETQLAAGQEPTDDYTPAILGRGMSAPFDLSTLIVIEAETKLLAKNADGKVRMQVASVARGGDAIEADDFLGAGAGDWFDVDIGWQKQPFFGMPEFSEVSSNGIGIAVTRGAAPGKLILYYPMNAYSPDKENQAQILD